MCVAGLRTDGVMDATRANAASYLESTNLVLLRMLQHRQEL